MYINHWAAECTVKVYVIQNVQPSLDFEAYGSMSLFRVSKENS